MTSDPRRFRSSDELANAVFGSAVPTVEQRKLREEQHARAQVPAPVEPEPRREEPRLSTTELGFSRLGAVSLPDPVPYDEVGVKGQIIPKSVGGDQARRIQAGIDATMRAVTARDARHNPVTSGAGPNTVTPAGAGVVRGLARWARPPDCVGNFSVIEKSSAVASGAS
jgi:hypothetical protein